MIKSFAIKTNNQKIIEYIISYFKSNSLSNYFLSKKQFKIYTNLIIHYIGKNEESFYLYVEQLLKNIVLEFYEKKFIKSNISYNFFYFTENEKKQIYNISKELLIEKESIYKTRINTLYHLCYYYIKQNKKMILDGFVNFRLKEYCIVLDELTKEAGSIYAIKKEYDNFILLLREYINQTPSKAKITHLIFFNNDSILLDEHKNIIETDKNISNAKYLSDISFSSNDYCLNTLLNILPKRIYLHLLNENENSDFLDTLLSIFGKRIIICLDCNICKYYKETFIKKSKI